MRRSDDEEEPLNWPAARAGTSTGLDDVVKLTPRKPKEEVKRKEREKSVSFQDFLLLPQNERDEALPSPSKRRRSSSLLQRREL